MRACLAISAGAVALAGTRNNKKVGVGARRASMVLPSFSSSSSTPLSLRLCRRRRSRPPRPPSAFFADDPASLASSLIDGALATAVVAGIVISALPLFSEPAGRAASKRAAARRSSAVARAEREKGDGDDGARTEEEIFEVETDLEEEEGFKWGLATVVACLPLVGFTAWAFAAVDETANTSSSSPSASRAPLYWAFAGIYALASLRHGLSLDAGAVAVALACAAHVQVESLSSGSSGGGGLLSSSSSSSSKEEEDYEVLFGRKEKVTPAQEAAEATSRAAARAAGVAAESAAAVARAVKAGLEDDDDATADRKALPADTRRRPPSKEDAEDRKYDADLLRSFDERLAEREKEREGGGGGDSGRS